MILSSAPHTLPGVAPLAITVVAMLAYALALLPTRTRAGSPNGLAAALLVGWVLHGVLLAIDIGGWGLQSHGVRLGFAPVLSITVWLVLAVHAIESRLMPPVPTVRRTLALAGALAVLLAWAFPGEMTPPASAWAPVHFVLGVASYGLFGAAVLHGVMLDAAERRLRSRAAAPTPAGLPLLQLERLTFRFVEAGFVVLTAALVLGAVTRTHWVWDHKTVFSLLGWVVFAGLLLGRRLRGWRGRRATGWLYGGAALLLLAYVGSRFVMEVVLQR